MSRNTKKDSILTVKEADAWRQYRVYSKLTLELAGLEYSGIRPDILLLSMKNIIIASGIVIVLAFLYSSNSDKSTVKSTTTSNVVNESFNSTDSYYNDDSFDSSDYSNVADDSDDYQPTFNGYECTDDCSGHEAGYEWAEENGIESTDDCGGNSDSFIEGCESFVEENYPEEDYYEENYYEEDYDYMY